MVEIIRKQWKWGSKVCWGIGKGSLESLSSVSVGESSEICGAEGDEQKSNSDAI